MFLQVTSKQKLMPKIIHYFSFLQKEQYVGERNEQVKVSFSLGKNWFLKNMI